MMINFIKKKIKSIFWDVHHLKPTIDVPSHWYGGIHSGFYVSPSQLRAEPIVYSFGVGLDISFDLALIENYNATVYGFDPTPKSESFIKSLSDLPQQYVFKKYGIDKQSGTAEFFLPTNDQHVSGSKVSHSNVSQTKMIQVEMKSFADIARRLGHGKIDIVKLDIEGSEYEVVPSILESGIAIDQILIEFHDRFFGKPTRSKQTVSLLADYGYHVFAASDKFQEISFIKM